MNWKVGDLGRFVVEDPKRPRFEVLGSKPERGIAVWYGGSARPVWVPEDTFKAKCVNHWNMDVVQPMPAWVAPKAIFQIEDARAANITQASIRVGYHKQISQVDVRGHDLQIRRIRFDYASCFDNTSKCLVMVPLKIIAIFGTQVLTKLERLLGDDPFGEDGDEITALLKSL